MPLLIFIFIIIPVIEISLFIKVGALIGVLPTVAAVFISSVVGMAIIRRQGFSTILRANAKIEKGELPANEVFEGFLLGIAGVLLILPGFFTDLIGLVLLIPFLRQYIARYLVFKGAVNGSAQSFSFRTKNDSQAHNTIEGEFSRDDDDDLPKLKKK